MSNLTPFIFEGSALRTAMLNGNVGFVAADACTILDIKNVSDALEKLDADEKGIGSTDTLGGAQRMLVVTEGGLYTLILRCRDAVTPGTTPHRFRKWVTSEVLPTIRKTGAYAIPVEEDDEAEPVASIAHLPQREVSLWLDMVRETRRLHGIHAARALWAQSPLPQPVIERPTANPEDIPEWKRQGKLKPQQKFTPEEAEAIRAEYKAGGCTTRSLAEKYGTCSANISRIIRHASYRTGSRLH